jgi:hypothetical protein
MLLLKKMFYRRTTSFVTSGGLQTQKSRDAVPRKFTMLSAVHDHADICL